MDASVIVAACLSEAGWELLREEELVAPLLARSEACSVLHVAAWRGEVSPADARTARDRLVAAPITFHAGTVEGPWDIASEFGWAKTYDAEYVALARDLGCKLVTLDERLKRAAGRIVPIVGPDELDPTSEDR